MKYDEIVVGGGTAGAIVAARLSEDRERSVLLLEAGSDFQDEAPEELRDGRVPVTSGYHWDLQALLEPGEDETASPAARRIARVFQVASSHLAPGQSVPRPVSAGEAPAVSFPYPMARILGGGSAVNGGLALHARPEDYAAWAAAGSSWWSWENVRPAIGRLEAADPARAALPIETTPPEAFTLFQRAFLETCLDKGFPRADVRPGTARGVGVIPKSTRRGRRVSTASLYLAEARKRPNLTIRSRCLVDRITFRAGGELTADGVEALIDGRRHHFSGARIILAAGTIHSPAILLRSGVGDPGEIARAGGTPVLSLPGVGKNLIDHPAVSLWAVPGPGTCSLGEPVHQAVLQQRSAASASLCDLQIFMLSSVPTRILPPLREIVGADLAVGLSVIVATPESRGRVELVDGDPLRSPRVWLNCLSEAADLRRMAEGVRSAWDLLQGERIASNLERVVLWNQSLIDSDQRLEKAMRTTVRGAWHPVGTLRMGPAGDAMAVVDPRGRLFGCGNVTVADGSIMPAIPSVPTNLTCMLIGERIAAHLRGSESGEPRLAEMSRSQQ